MQGSIQLKGSTARPCSHLAVADSLQDLGRQILGGAWLGVAVRIRVRGRGRGKGRGRGRGRGRGSYP